jgi:hypothetical protein
VGRFKGGERSEGQSIVIYVEVKEQNSQRIRDNGRISTDEIASEVSIINGKSRCKNGLRHNQRYFVLMQSGKTCGPSGQMN